MTPSREKIESLLKETEENLIVEIAKELQGRPILPVPFDQLLDQGKRWLISQQKNLKYTICNDNSIHDLFVNSNDTVQLVIAVADLITGLCVGVSPFTVATFLVKVGLKSFCHENWTNYIRK